MANADQRACDFLKNFAGDIFCISTEDRITYLYVQDDGTIALPEHVESDCEQIKTSEKYLCQLWRKVGNRETIDIKEFNENVDLPSNMKKKILWMNLR